MSSSVFGNVYRLSGGDSVFANVYILDDAGNAAIVTTRLALVGTSRHRLRLESTSAHRVSVTSTSEMRLGIEGASR